MNKCITIRYKYILLHNCEEIVKIYLETVKLKIIF
ncbi:hypothetical protein N692_00180 [Lactiplantibacillus plantarum EGD-AQ4]|nr:hypothetical protein N692_00180 [Lactiplantibacillus plantarum EGD-AQ4]